MSVEWKPGMVDTDGCIVTAIDAFGNVWARDLDGDACVFGVGVELDYAHPSNVGHILAHVRAKLPGVKVGLVCLPDGEWVGEIAGWIVEGTLPDVLRAMVGRVSNV
jgi:hypothetical protein